MTLIMHAFLQKKKYYLSCNVVLIIFMVILGYKSCKIIYNFSSKVLAFFHTKIMLTHINTL